MSIVLKMSWKSILGNAAFLQSFAVKVSNIFHIVTDFGEDGFKKQGHGHVTITTGSRKDVCRVDMWLTSLI